MFGSELGGGIDAVLIGPLSAGGGHSLETAYARRRILVYANIQNMLPRDQGQCNHEYLLMLNSYPLSATLKAST